MFFHDTVLSTLFKIVKVTIDKNSNTFAWLIVRYVYLCESTSVCACEECERTSNINEVIRAVLKFLILFTKRFRTH